MPREIKTVCESSFHFDFQLYTLSFAILTVYANGFVYCVWMGIVLFSGKRNLDKVNNNNGVSIWRIWKQCIHIPNIVIVTDRYCWLAFMFNSFIHLIGHCYGWFGVKSNKIKKKITIWARSSFSKVRRKKRDNKNTYQKNCTNSLIYQKSWLSILVGIWKKNCNLTHCKPFIDIL